MAKPLSQERRAALIASSRKAAAALLDDIAYLREVIEKPTDAAEVRRLSSVLRRLLIECDIQIVAAPRVGKIMIPTPDNDRFYKLAKNHPLRIFASGGTKIFGRAVEWIYGFDGPNVNSMAELADRAKQTLDRDALAGPRTKIDLALDSFLRQKVLYLSGDWASRAAVIKYVANVSSGVHSGTPKAADEKVLSLISHNNKISYDKDKDHFAFNLGDNPNKEFSYAPESIDLVLVELLATAKFVVEAPDIINLENVTRQELKPPSL